MVLFLRLVRILGGVNLGQREIEAKIKYENVTLFFLSAPLVEFLSAKGKRKEKKE